MMSLINKLIHRWKYRNKWQRSIFIGNTSRTFIFSKPATKEEIETLQQWKIKTVLDGIIEKHHGLSAKILYNKSRDY